MNKVQQLKEALGVWDRLHSQDLNLNQIKDAARSHLALRQECDQCGGKGSGLLPVRKKGSFTVDCPFCQGRGMVVSDQAVEKAQRELVQALGRLPSPPKIVLGFLDTRDIVRAVLEAALFGEEEESTPKP